MLFSFTGNIQNIADDIRVILELNETDWELILYVFLLVRLQKNQLFPSTCAILKVVLEFEQTFWTNILAPPGKLK